MRVLLVLLNYEVRIFGLDLLWYDHSSTTDWAFFAVGEGSLFWDLEIYEVRNIE